MSTEQAPRKSSVFRTVVAVMWGFLGVRRRSDYEKDITHHRPLQLVAVYLVMAIVFVGVLIALAMWAAS
jgi:uncharacterized membrane protein YidH (DUF202 family)